MPDVTVLMSVYNGQPFIQNALESILHQTWRDFEFLILNDGSTDDSRDIILSYNDNRIRLVDNPTRLGLAKSLNRGLGLAKGELIARQDADDISHPDRLHRQIQHLKSHPEIELLGAGARAIDDAGQPKNVELRMPTGLAAIRWYLMFHNAFIHSSVIFRRRTILADLGGYNESFDRGQDYDLWSRTARSFKVENLPDVLLDYRYEYGSVSSLAPLPSAGIEEVILKNLRIFLHDQSIPAACARFILRFRSLDKFSRNTNWKHIAQMFQKTHQKFCSLYPEAESDRMIRSHLASNLYWVAYYAASLERRVSIQTYLKAKKLAPKTKRIPSLARFMALWLGGEKARGAYQHLWQRNAVHRNLNIFRNH